MKSVKQIVFLVGGLGTRLGARTKTIPKPLMPVGGRPFLDYLIENAVGQGFSDILLAGGYLAGVMGQHYSERGPAGTAIRLVTEPAPAGTGGALNYLRDLLEPQFVLCNGDSFFQFDFSCLNEALDRKDIVGVLALRDHAPGERYGTVSLDGDQVVAFHDPAENRPGPINAGIYLLRREILDWLGDPPGSLERDIFPRLAKAGKLRSVVRSGYFIDIGVPEDLERAQVEVPAFFHGPAAV